MDEMREALDKAAASPDPAVRNMAIRYQEIRSEFDQYEAFFNIYKQGITKNGTATAVRPAITRERVMVPRASRTHKVDSFSSALQTVITTYGQPMMLKELYSTYLEQHPEDQTTIETFRQRLVKRRKAPDGSALISLVKGRGYWWAGAPLPEEAGDAQ